MALTEETVVGSIAVDEYATIHVKMEVRIYRDGELLTTENQRHLITRGSDTSEEDPRVQAIAVALWDRFEWPDYPVVEEPEPLEQPPEPELVN